MAWRWKRARQLQMTSAHRDDGGVIFWMIVSVMVIDLIHQSRSQTMNHPSWSLSRDVCASSCDACHPYDASCYASAPSYPYDSSDSLSLILSTSCYSYPCFDFCCVCPFRASWCGCDAYPCLPSYDCQSQCHAACHLMHVILGWHCDLDRDPDPCRRR